MAFLVILYILFAAYGWLILHVIIIEKLVDWQLNAKTKWSERSREAISLMVILVTGIALLMVFLLIGAGLAMLFTK
jgi:hypothetical protein